MGALAQSNETDWPQGYVQVYTGDGKGKTTAAFGLALRAVGAGLRVYIAQFAKSRNSGELDAIAQRAVGIEIGRFGGAAFIRRAPTAADIAAARQGLCEVRTILAAGRHRVVILDEANIATHFGLFPVDELLALIALKPAHVELVITGRRADPRLIERADLVTEMREVKHYHAHGVAARRGIEY